MGQVCGSSDDYHRSVQIRLPSRRVITRPINLVSRFEITSNSTSTQKPAQCTKTKEKTAPLPSHPMVTRSKAARQLCYNAFSLAFLMPALLPLVFSSRCPHEITIDKRILYATPCVARGIAVATYSKDNRNHVCWFPVTCPNGEIRASFPFPQDGQLCGSRCECPKWAQFCSHYNGSLIQQSLLSTIPARLLDFVPDNVCSFKESPNCSKHKKIGFFNQIQLYDGTILLVPRLQITVKDYLTPNDFICVNSEGRRVDPTSPFQGTSLFCERHNCDEAAENFCMHDTPIALFDYSDAQESNKMIPIKAWGTTTREFYGHKSNGSSNAVSLSVMCSKGGITLQSNQEVDTIEACITSFCIFISQTSAKSLLFPTELIAFKYDVVIKVWQKGILVHQASTTCPPHPICEVLHCRLCLEHIYNTQCWRTLDIAFAISMFLLITTLCWILIPLIAIIKKLLNILLFPVKQLFKLLRRIRSCRLTCRNTTSTSADLPYRPYGHHRRRSRFHRISPALMSITLFATIMCNAHCCSDVVSISTATESCSSINSTETCFINQGVTLSLQPLGQEVCLSIRNFKQEPIALISLRIKSILHVCQKKIEFFTRDHAFSSESSHRCYRAGSCQPEKCDNTKSSDKISEFSWKATKYPGFTFCKASCPGFMCGCFFFSPSCLFYKYYAAPTSNITYTIFTCPVWELTVAAEMTQQLQQEKQTHTVTLTPGRATRINDVTLSLIATISPQLPLLTSTFITDGSKTAMTMKVQANELTPATPAQLQCSSESEAKNFKCRFASRACSCSTGPYKATCTCPEGEVSKYLRENLLPLTTKNVMIENYADTIAAHTQVGSALQVHINMDNVKIVSIQNHATCSIESSSLEGCYSCLLGARVTIVCYSTEKTTTADIICGQQQQITTCTETGKLSEVIFHFNTPTVSTRCTVSCPGGNTSFHLSGVLIYVSESELQNEISTINDFSVNQPAGFTAAIKGVSSFFRKLDFSPLTNLLTLLNLIKLIVFSSVLTVIVLLMTSVTSNLSKLKRSY